MKKKFSFILLILMMFFMACKKDGSSSPVSNDVLPTPINISLTSPINGATNQDTSLTLSWSGTGTSYDLYFGTSSSALTKIVSDISGTSYTKNELNKGTTYYWKVVGKKDAARDTSEVRSFTTKIASINISLISPINGASSQDTSIVLSWSGTGTSYDLYFGTSSSALTKIVSDISGTSYTKNELNKGTTYYWKVVGKKDAALDTSEVRSFTTKIASINVSLISPINGASNQDTSIVLSWSGTGTSYDLYFGTSSSSLTKIVSDISGTSYTKNELNKGTTYYWKVVGKKDAALDTSEVRSFTTKIASINVSLISPINGASNQDTSIVLSWSGTGTSYDLYFGTSSSALTKIVSDISGTSYTKNELNKGTTYYWKVVGKNATALDTSEVRSFTTKIAPINVSLISPINGASNQDTSIVLSWSGTGTSYDLYFGTSSSALTKIVSDISGTSYTKNELNKGTTYYWKVVGKKDAALDTSEVRSFSTKIINLEMIFVEADTFSMGSISGESDEQPVHKVKITNNFYIGKYEVTNEQLVKVFNKAKEKNISGLIFTSNLVTYNDNQLFLLGGSIIYNNSSGYLEVNNSKENYAAEGISYYGAEAFVEFLNTLNNTNIYKLPTEAQWEFAARGGKQSQHYIYAGSNNIDEVAWYISNSSSTTHQVGTKKSQ